ncbi:SMP-30/gluconolactonase/LRE family protein [Pontibacillus marinus]|uniref:SMP-30/gluconolactonase/LRE family protein n=1 Tax=Pontibacillus marinus TaxID=273164 RepID=UPI000482388D|nr:SMP-30/gluconolactonase/LRE family protein [Pontibacillus marinus]
MNVSVELVFDYKCTLGEGPTWDHKRNLFYWVDILQHKLYRYNSTDQEVDVAVFDQPIGCVVPRESGDVVVALQNGFFFYDWERDELDPIEDPEHHLPKNRFNDGKCDPKGRFWAGTTDEYGVDGNGALYVLEQDLSVMKKVGNVGTSNGLAWSLDNQYMYFIDTPTKQVVRYNFDLESGAIDQPKTVIEFPEHCGFPDGMTIDQEGMLWIAGWSGYGVSRWNPYTGEQLDFIPVPAKNVTSCAFGGEDLSDLYITTARTGTSDEELEQYPHAGGVFRVETNVKGSRNFRFEG